MALAESLVLDRASSHHHPLVDIVVPVYNEERDLEPNIVRLRDYLDARFPFAAIITIVDNASTDDSWNLACKLSEERPGVRAMHLDQKGKGRALRAAWSASDAEVVAYTDVDLSTDLDALLPLVAPLISGHSDVAVGSRLARGARVVRGPKRELISRAYNLLLRTLLRNGVSDSQCGFKAVRKATAMELLPQVTDDHWFFDTELIVMAQRNRLRVHEVPVDWVDDLDSKVDLTRTALSDLQGVWRLMRNLSVGRGYGRPTETPASGSDHRELSRFAGVGAVSTVVYLVILAGLLVGVAPALANLLALSVAVAGNSLAHATYTIRPSGRIPWRQALMGGLVVLAVTGATTSAAVQIAELVGARSTLDLLAAVLTGSVVAAAVRFLVVQAWTFRLHLKTSS